MNYNLSRLYLCPILLAYMLVANSVFAEDLGSYGPSFEIHEQDLTAWIQKRLQGMQADGRLETAQQAITQKIITSLKNPQENTALIRTITPRTFTVDLSLTLSADIRDHRNRLIHAAGTRINPAEHRTLSRALLFIDARDPAQMAWALKQPEPRKIILVAGAPFERIVRHGLRGYYDQGGRLAK